MFILHDTVVWLTHTHSHTHQLEGRLQLSAAAEQAHPGQYVEPQPCSRHGHHQTPHISQVTNMLCPHQRQNDEVILLSLVSIHCGNLVLIWEQYERRGERGGGVILTYCITILS